MNNVDITDVAIHVKIKDVARRRKQFKKNSIKTFWKKSLKELKKLLTRFKLSDILRKSLKGDNIKQKNTTQVVKENWSLKIEHNIYKYI